MNSVTFIQPSGTPATVAVETGTSLMRAAVTNGVDGIVGECGG